MPLTSKYLDSLLTISINNGRKEGISLLRSID